MTISAITYHYIRNNEEYDCKMHARRWDEFEAQVRALTKTDDGILNVNDKEKIEYYLKNEQKNGIILTFDDGYKEHLKCSEYLYSIKCNGIFFIATSTLKGKFLDANIAHTILGKTKITSEKIAEKAIKHFGRKIMAQTNGKKLTLDEYSRIFSEKLKNSDTRYDKMIKRLIQRDMINSDEKRRFIDYLYEELNIEKGAIPNDHYLTKADLKKMRALGMNIGSHTENHKWLSTLEKKFQEREINEAIEWLMGETVMERKDVCYFSYPYGDYNNTTLNVLKESLVDYSFTCIKGKALVKGDEINDRHLLKRYNTNDIWDNDYRMPNMELVRK